MDIWKTPEDQDNSSGSTSKRMQEDDGILTTEEHQKIESSKWVAPEA